MANMEKDSMLIFHVNAKNMAEELNDEELGKVFRALIQFELDGLETEFEDRVLSCIYKLNRDTLKRNRKKYEAKCQRNRENINKRWAKEKSVETPDEVKAQVRKLYNKSL